MARSPRFTIATVTPPPILPASLEDLKSFARIDGTEEDGLLDGFLQAATEAAQQYTRRSFIGQSLKATYDLEQGCPDNWLDGCYDLPANYFDGGLPEVIELPRGPIRSVTSVVTYDESNAPSAYDPANYSLIGNRVVLAEDAYWPTSLRRVGALEITYSAGFGDERQDVPQPIRTAILIHAALLHETRGACGCDPLPDSCRMLLGQYRAMDL